MPEAVKVSHIYQEYVLKEVSQRKNPAAGLPQHSFSLKQRKTSLLHKLIFHAESLKMLQALSHPGYTPIIQTNIQSQSDNRQTKRLLVNYNIFP